MIGDVCAVCVSARKQVPIVSDMILTVTVILPGQPNGVTNGSVNPYNTCLVTPLLDPTLLSYMAPGPC